MDLSEAKVGDEYTIVGVPPNEPCLNCIPCIKLRIMELGIMPGERIRIEGHHLGLWIIAILNSSNRASSTVAMREEEVLGIIVK